MTVKTSPVPGLVTMFTFAVFLRVSRWIMLITTWRKIENVFCIYLFFYVAIHGYDDILAMWLKERTCNSYIQLTEQSSVADY